MSSEFYLGGIGMKKGISLIVVISLLVAMTSFFVSANSAMSLSASGATISLELTIRLRLGISSKL